MNRGISIIMNKKKVALVFGITENYVFALANTLIGLKNITKNFGMILLSSMIIFLKTIKQI